MKHLYVAQINNYFYGIRGNGLMIFTHLDQCQYEDFCSENCGIYDFMRLASDDPDSLSLWNNLVKLNRLQNPKGEL